VTSAQPQRAAAQRARPGFEPLRHALLALAVLLCTYCVGIAQAQVAVPRLQARVTDLTGTLTAEQRQALETRLAQFESRKGAQIAVLLVPSTLPESIEQYARRVLDEWKLGRKDVDDGALLLVAMQDRKLRIETQYGLEGVLPDATAKRIIDEIVTPRFRQQDFYGGISAGIERMIAVVDGEPLPPPSPAARGKDAGSNFESLLMVGFALVFVVAGILRAMFGRVGGAALTGGIGGVIAWFIVGSLLAAGAVALIVFVLSTIMGVAGMGRRMHRGGWTGGHWGGGMGGGSWGGGGGWSGGGGFGGGGGASGSW
jgi:uncharacterized protein